MEELGKNFCNIRENVAQGEDLYKAFASERFGKPIDEVTAEERRAAKTRVMHAVYGNDVVYVGEEMLPRPEELQRHIRDQTA